jgi:hypothetical protein
VFSPAATYPNSPRKQRTEYYTRLCSSLGLNPLTQPFEYLTLNGKLVLYAKRAGADQLRKIMRTPSVPCSTIGASSA